MSRILIAEDEDRIGSFLEKSLRAAGSVTPVVTGGETAAAALARDADFARLVLDLGLPEIDGHVVLRQMRQRGEHMPVADSDGSQWTGATVAGYLKEPMTT